MCKRVSALLVLIAVIMVAMVVPSSAEEYPKHKALTSLINPHNQIDDEGEVLWGKCLLCHQEVPDIKKSKSILDVRLRFEDDLKVICFRCHPERMHPGGSWFGVTGAGKGRGVYEGAPNHWVKPPEDIAGNIKTSLERYYIMLPLEPKSGKIFCATCHNPHERGLLLGKADVGADGYKRWRSGNYPICNYCHLR